MAYSQWNPASLLFYLKNQSKPKKKKRKVPFPKEPLILAGIAVGVMVLLKLDFIGTGPSVGQKAPEIVGTIQDGTKVRLSDFRKKVIFLDFWGDW